MNDRLARFAGAYALANLGAFLFFVPLMGLSLPQRMTELAENDAIQWLSWALLLGALVASVANIAGGAISDRWLARKGTRLPIIWAGLVLTLLSFIGLVLANTIQALIAAFLLFQLVFNLMFAPMSALVTDYVPDADKGKVFGVLSFALPASQASIFLMVAADLDTIDVQLIAVAAVGLLLILPLLCRRPPPLLAPHAPLISNESGPKWLSRDFTLAWFARLLVQCTSVAMGSYIFIHLTRTLAADSMPGAAELWMGRFAVLAACAGIMTGIVLGTASDRAGRRRLFLWPTSLAVSIGCTMLACSSEPMIMAAGYALFAFGLAGFLTVDGAMVAQLVGSVPNRAAALGVMNLTNTLSGVLVPAAVLALHQSTTMPTSILFVMAAAGGLLAAALVAMIQSVD